MQRENSHVYPAPPNVDREGLWAIFTEITDLYLVPLQLKSKAITTLHDILEYVKAYIGRIEASNSSDCVAKQQQQFFAQVMNRLRQVVKNVLNNGSAVLMWPDHHGELAYRKNTTFLMTIRELRFVDEPQHTALASLYNSVIPSIIIIGLEARQTAST